MMNDNINLPDQNNGDNVNIKKNVHNSIHIGIGIVVLVVMLLGVTYAYYTYSASNNSITGDAGEVNLSLSVDKILPSTTGIDDILITNTDELADSLNDGCTDSDGEFALCQLYKVTLTNNSSDVNTDVKGSISFNNENTPNLSWMLVEGYSASTTYTTDSLGTNYNTSSSTFTNFVDSYLLNAGSTVNYYILVWINETDDVQNDEGSYGGTIRFEDTNGDGVTAVFTR